MKRNVWTSPLGLAFIIGGLAALIAGYFTGAGMRGSETNLTASSYNMASDNLAEPYTDENALIAANREPPAPEPEPQAAPPPVAAPAPQTTNDIESDIAAPPEDEPPQMERRPRDRRNAEPPSEDEQNEDSYAPR